jgi:hypothetical protein
MRINKYIYILNFTTKILKQHKNMRHISSVIFNIIYILLLWFIYLNKYIFGKQLYRFDFMFVCFFLL